MGRYSASDENSFVSGVITPSASMPISGVFGSGRVAVISKTQNFIIPAATIRVRLWGAGASSVGGGGGFAMKVLTGLTIGQSVVATIAAKTSVITPGPGGTTSFGAYVSATGGKRNPNDGGIGVGGDGVGGDVNTTGGSSGTWSASNASCGGGGAANLLGDGGDGGSPNQPGTSGSSGGGGAAVTNYQGTIGGFGLAPAGDFGIDFIGCGSGTGGPAGNTISEVSSAPNAGNGGGGGSGKGGGFPGGGGGAQGPGAAGLMIVEW